MPAKTGSKSRKSTPMRPSRKAKAPADSPFSRLIKSSRGKALLFALVFMIVGGGIWFVSAATSTYSLWSNSAIPRVITSSDTRSVELGVKFHASVAGYVTGVRFYKGPQNTGTHTGNLWDSKGNLLASVKFTNETASGWQSAMFAKPISIASNATYVISYHAPVGRYSINASYFKNRSHSRNYLTAPQNTSTNPNGVLNVGGSSTFPTQSGGGANYWVDVLFSTKIISASSAPAAPVNVAGSAQAGKVNVTWSASVSDNPITHYLVYRNGQKIADVGAALLYTDASVVAGTTYNYQVQAVDSTGTPSALSTAITVLVPSSSPPVTTSAWPGPTNTGIPAGTVLGSYTNPDNPSNPCTIKRDGTIIDSKTVNCDLDIQAANVMIKNSKINGRVELRSDLPGATAWSFTIQDTEVNGGTPQLPAVSGINVTVLRDNIHGAAASVHCDELKSSYCHVEDSWLHGQYMPVGANWHLSAFSLKGGYNVTLRHNSLICDAIWNNDGGCTADVDLIPDFAPVSNVLVDHNYLGASLGDSYCAYGGDGPTKPYPNADHVVFQNNVFARGSNNKCGAYGPVTDFNVNGTGNQWTNNTWEDGATVPPEF